MFAVHLEVAVRRVGSAHEVHVCWDTATRRKRTAVSWTILLKELSHGGWWAQNEAGCANLATAYRRHRSQHL